ncbi:unnamed protein product [Paramecium pentaurelia]|uniref:Uncharacterized protein n=1 Tax=Paramecium pentaurelia TaxID=43138 RepID=A0A8S1XUC8_9CILI|nr:unnamed protein product [Paramecium pentaurelia]
MHLFKSLDAVKTIIGQSQPKQQYSFISNDYAAEITLMHGSISLFLMQIIHKLRKILQNNLRQNFSLQAQILNKEKAIVSFFMMNWHISIFNLRFQNTRQILNLMN